MKNIGRLAVRGTAVTAFGQAGKFLIQFSTLAILARILAPDDFGLYGMAFVVISFAQMVQDSGLTMAVVQRKEVKHAELSNLFWLNLAVSSLIGACVLLSAKPMAAFYTRPEISGLVSFLAIAVIFNGSASLFRAILRRNFKFKSLVGIDLITIGLASACAIFAAYYGAEYWSFGVQAVSLSIFGFIGFGLSSRFFPSSIEKNTSIREYLRYGLNHAGFKIVNFFSRNGDNVIIAKFSTPELLGFYVNAYKLVMLPLQQLTAPINQALLPALSQMQDDAKRFSAAYDKSLSVLCAIAIPAVIVISINAHEIVELILGPGWEQSAKLFLCLAPAALVGASNMGTGWVYLALGHTDRQLRWGIINSAAMLSAMFIGFYINGVYGLAIGISAIFVCMRIPGVLYCFRGTSLTLISFLRPHLIPFYGCAVASLASIPLKSLVPDELKLLTGISTFTMIYMMYLLATSKGRILANDLLSMLKNEKV